MRKLIVCNILIGSATLARFLMQAGLVDEYWFLVHPIVLGRGKRLFPDGMGSAGLTLIESKAFRSGVVLLRYQPDRKASVHALRQAWGAESCTARKPARIASCMFSLYDMLCCFH